MNLLLGGSGRVLRMTNAFGSFGQTKQLSNSKCLILKNKTLL